MVEKSTAIVMLGKIVMVVTHVDCLWTAASCIWSNSSPIIVAVFTI